MDDRECESSRIQVMHREFCARYAPEDRSDRDQFEAHLATLLHAVAKDAVQPFATAAASAIANQAPKPVYIKKEQ